MQINTRKLTFVIIFSFLLISEIFSQGKITGLVRDANYTTPLKDVLAELYYDNGKDKISETGTDGTGFFAFNDLKFGLYELKISLKGYSGYEISYIRISEETPDAPRVLLDSGSHVDCGDCRQTGREARRCAWNNLGAGTGACCYR